MHVKMEYIFTLIDEKRKYIKKTKARKIENTN